jgi:hypothetical protein
MKERVPDWGKEFIKYKVKNINKNTKFCIDISGLVVGLKIKKSLFLTK